MKRWELVSVIVAGLALIAVVWWATSTPPPAPRAPQPAAGLTGELIPCEFLPSGKVGYVEVIRVPGRSTLATMLDDSGNRPWTDAAGHRLWVFVAQTKQRPEVVIHGKK